MWAKRSCMARITRTSTVPSPTPASKTRTAGGRGWIWASSSETRLATSHFSLQVLTKSRYFLPIVEEAEIALRVAQLGRRRGRKRRKRRRGFRGSFDDDGTWPVGRVGSHEAVDAVERIGRDPTAVAQPGGELAVIDGAASECRFGKSGLAAIIADFLKQLLGVHGTAASYWFPRPRRAAILGLLCARSSGRANQLGRRGSTTKLPTVRSGQDSGIYLTLSAAKIARSVPPRRPRTFGARLLSPLGRGEGRRAVRRIGRWARESP